MPPLGNGGQNCQKTIPFVWYYLEANRPTMSKRVGKQQLLDQATALFRAKGYSATSIDDVAKACGITKGSLYYHFQGKEELALAAMESVHAYFRENIFGIILDTDCPGSNELAKFNEAVEDFFSSHRDGCLLANLSLEIENQNDLFKEKIRYFFNDWRRCYEEVFRRDYLQSRASTLAADAVAIVHGCILMQRINGDIEPLRRQHRLLVGLISRDGPELSSPS